MVWLVIMLIFVSLLLVGSMIENANLKAKGYEVELLRDRIKERD